MSIEQFLVNFWQYAVGRFEFIVDEVSIIFARSRIYIIIRNFSQFFIDERYQGNGYGYLAACKIIDMMKTDGKFRKVILCYIEGNEAAKKMYEKMGFYHTGENDGNEIIMQMDL